MEEEKYHMNGKIYNITKSEKLYENITRENTNVVFAGSYRLTRDVKTRYYKSAKGNLFKTIVKSGRITIDDINESEFLNELLRNSELELLEKYYPKKYNEIEEC